LGKKFWIVIAVVLLLGSGFVLGAVGLIAAMVPTAFVVAEALQQSESLGEGAFAISWWLSWLGLGAILVLCFARWLRKRQGAVLRAATLPLWIYGAVHLVAAWAFGLSGLAPVFHVSARLMAYAIQTVQIYISWVFPLVLLSIFVRALWRWANASWVEDGRGAQIAGVLLGGALLCSIAAATGLFIGAGYTVVGLSDLGQSNDWFSPTADRASHLVFASMAIAPYRPEPYVDARPLLQREQMTFGECADQLRKGGDLKNCAKRAERAMPNDGKDIASNTMINVCHKVETNGGDGLASYYNRACTNAISSEQNKRMDPVDVLRPGGTPPSLGILRGIDCVERVSNALSRSERRVLELATLGHKPRQIAKLIGEAENTVSQRLSRLYKMLRESCFSEYRPTYRRRFGR
jgi:DNA-directed RNA polymerase specialized sigma24 family protein